MIPGVQEIERMAPDQASMSAAVKLAKPATWSNLQRSADGHLYWGECQGSGANPYRVTFDTADPGSKCTCPSRKFPCKHVLALMLLAQKPGFVVAPVPDWVSDWMGRRRKPTTAEARKPTGGSMAAALQDTSQAAVDPADLARTEAARLKREATTRAAITAGLQDLEAWISDQLASGLASLLSDLIGRSRRIAARMMDAKASGLASRIDEMPSRVLAHPPERRIDALTVELGQLVLMARAWGQGEAPEPGLLRGIATTETRDALLGNPEALHLRSTWKVAATQERTRRDGLVSQATWCLNLGSGPSFALLLDFFPASAGKRQAAFAPHAMFAAEMVYYPSRLPLRAQIVERDHVPSTLPVPAPPADPLATFHDALHAEPWALTVPLHLPEGRLARGPNGSRWWTAGDLALPAQNREIPPLAMGLDLTSSTALWDGFTLTLMSAETKLGEIAFDV